MPSYVLMMKLTDQGAKEIKEAPARIEAGIKACEAMGGKVVSFYATMGDYDYVAIAEGPGDETATSFAMVLSAGGNVRTTTARAFAKEEFAAMVGKLP